MFAGWDWATGSHDVTVVDDAAHAIGSRYRAADGDLRPIGDGRLSAMTTFSFHPVKTIAMGEGGAVTTNDEDLALRLQRLRSHGVLREAADQGLTVFETAPDSEAATAISGLADAVASSRAGSIRKPLTVLG